MPPSYGYTPRGHNLFYLPGSAGREIAYSANGVGVVYQHSREVNQQRFFRGHDGLITR